MGGSVQDREVPVVDIIFSWPLSWWPSNNSVNVIEEGEGWIAYRMAFNHILVPDGQENRRKKSEKDSSG